ncbi:hypothetical protein RJ639_012372 [Escallonia herrerae]|uniref:TFIIE beta domain-containing protein n=1 Tax=Escallonia herrerae TaxID=1293975 RepID=A0AA89AQF3_9ASTE|nr:hypothetical protein RJ639_012372 [Escallonia herrerae]
MDVSVSRWASALAGQLAGCAWEIPKCPRKRSRCLSTLASIAARVRSTRTPVGAQIKRAIEFLRETRQDLTPDEIVQESNVEKSVITILKKNPELKYDGKRFSYKAKYDVTDGDELFNLIRKFPDGIIITDLQDAYPNVMEDLESFSTLYWALKAAGRIWVLRNLKKQEFAYPNDPRANIKVDNDLKKLFHNVKLPQDMLYVENDLKKNGMQPATDTARRRAMAQIRGMASCFQDKEEEEGWNHQEDQTDQRTPSPALFQGYLITATG